MEPVTPDTPLMIEGRTSTARKAAQAVFPYEPQFTQLLTDPFYAGAECHHQSTKHPVMHDLHPSQVLAEYHRRRTGVMTAGDTLQPAPALSENDRQWLRHMIREHGLRQMLNGLAAICDDAIITKHSIVLDRSSSGSTVYIDGDDLKQTAVNLRKELF